MLTSKKQKKYKSLYLNLNAMEIRESYQAMMMCGWTLATLKNAAPHAA
jgi:hypothetical protein